VRKIITILFCLTLIFSLVSAQEAKLRPMTVDDALNMVRLQDVHLSPDGKWVFFSKSELDWSHNKRTKKFFMIPASGGKAQQYIGEAGYFSCRSQAARLFSLPTTKTASLPINGLLTPAKSFLRLMKC